MRTIRPKDEQDDSTSALISALTLPRSAKEDASLVRVYHVESANPRCVPAVRLLSANVFPIQGTC